MTRTELKQTRPQLFKAMLGLEISCKKLNRITDKIWAKSDYRCSYCNKYYTDPMEIGFLQANGMCIGCDHIKGEIDFRIQYEADSVRDEMEDK